MRPLFYVFLLWIAAPASAQEQRFQYTQPKMGSPFHLIFYAADSATANNLAKQSFLLIDSLNTIFSDYDPQSEVSRLSATAGRDSFAKVSPLLFRLIVDSKKGWQKSSGTFDITIGVLSRLWRNSRRTKSFPAKAAVDSARQTNGFENILIDTATQSIQLLKKGMQLDFGGIAKGYIAGAVVQYLGSKGVTSAMADAGGDIVCSAAPPGKKGWTIGVNIPQQTDELLDEYIQLEHRAVATSGDVYQYTEHKGKKYSHIINPLTGYGVTFQRNVTVIAPDGATADWLATACSILRLRKAKRLALAEGAQVLITEMHKGKLKKHETKGFKQYWMRQ